MKRRSIENRIRAAEAALFTSVGADVEESTLALARTGLRVRLVAGGSGPPLVLLHGVSLSAAVWAPLFAALPGRRLLAVDLPGHGLSDPVHYAPGRVRAHSHRLIEDIFDALELDRAPVVGHSLGGMFALWHVTAGEDRISRLVAIGDPAVAIPGAYVRMPLSLLTVRGLGEAMLRAPSPAFVHRRMLDQGLGGADLAAAPGSLAEVLRLAGRRPENAKTIASLMRSIDRFRRPRPESVLTSAELAGIGTPTMFVWGSQDPYLSPGSARPWIERIPGATLHEMPAGHAPWLMHPGRSADLIEAHLGAAARRSA